MRQEKTKKPVANFMIADSPLCDLMQMGDNIKRYCWNAVDFSENVEKNEKLAIMLKTEEDGELFKSKFNEAKVFNQKARNGVPKNKLDWAEVIVDEEEKEFDDIDTNVMATAGNADEEN